MAAVAKARPAAGYQGLARVTDPAMRETLRIVMDRVSSLEAQLRDLEAAALKMGSPVNAYGQRISNVGNPQAPTDAVNVLALQRYVAQALPTPAIPRPAPAGTADEGVEGTPHCLPSDRLPLYDGSQIVTDVFAANPGFVGTSCQSAPGGSWGLLDAIVDALRLADTRFAYNGKRGNPGDPSGDAIAYDYGAVAGGEGSINVYVVDVISGHCSANPLPAWQDVSAFGPGIWTSRGRF